MKKISILAIASFLFITAFARLENTRWKTILQVNGPLNTIIDFKKIPFLFTRLQIAPSLKQ